MARCAVQTMSLLHVDVNKPGINAHPGWLEGSTYQALCNAGGRSQCPIQSANHAACPSRTGASCHVSESTPQIYLHGTPSSLVHCCELATFTQLCLEKHQRRNMVVEGQNHRALHIFACSRLVSLARHSLVVKSCSQSTGC